MPRSRAGARRGTTDPARAFAARTPLRSTTPPNSRLNIGNRQTVQCTIKTSHLCCHLRRSCTLRVPSYGTDTWGYRPNATYTTGRAHTPSHRQSLACTSAASTEALSAGGTHETATWILHSRMPAGTATSAAAPPGDPQSWRHVPHPPALMSRRQTELSTATPQSLHSRLRWPGGCLRGSAGTSPRSIPNGSQARPIPPL